MAGRVVLCNPADGRSMLVQLTPLARDMLPGVDQVITAVNTLALEQLSPDERQHCLALLGKVIGVLKAQDEA